MAYDVNDAERVTFNYRNSGGTLANPTVVTATITTPAGVPTTYTYGVGGELVRDSTGVYHIDVTFTAAGTWTVEGHGTGAVTAAIPPQHFIVASGSTLDVISLAEGKTALNNDVSSDDELAVYISAASQSLDDYIGPIVQRVVTDQPYDGGRCSIILRDIHTAPVTVTTVKEYLGTTLTTLTAETVSSQTAGQYVARDGVLYRRSGGYDTGFANGRSNILVTYTVGRAASTATVAEKYKIACQLILRKLWSGRGAGAGDLFTGTDGASITPGIPSFALPNAVKDLVGREHVPGVG